MLGTLGSRMASQIIAFLPMSRCFALKRWLLRTIGGLKVGPGVEIWSGARFVGRYIELGENCHIGEDCYVCGLSEYASIKIGKEVSFGPGVFMTVGTHDIGSSKRRSGEGRLYSIEVGDGTAISARAMIMPNVKIGPGCFIGPGVVVSSNVKPNTMLSPATARKMPIPEEGIAWE